MAYVDLEQGTQAWLEWRRGGLGGSDAAAIMGLSPFKERAQLLAELAGRRRPEEASFAMRRGTRLEPVARREYEQRFGACMPPCCVQHDELGWLRASLDGLDLAGELILEIKWPRWETHELALNGEVPLYYLVQVQHQLFATGAAAAHYWSCSDNKRFKAADCFALVEVLPDWDLVGNMLAAEMLFWQDLEEARNGPQGEQGLFPEGRGSAAAPVYEA